MVWLVTCHLESLFYLLHIAKKAVHYIFPDCTWCRHAYQPIYIALPIPSHSSALCAEKCTKNISDVTCYFLSLPSDVVQPSKICTVWFSSLCRGAESRVVQAGVCATHCRRMNALLIQVRKKLGRSLTLCGQGCCLMRDLTSEWRERSLTWLCTRRIQTARNNCSAYFHWLVIPSVKCMIYAIKM